MASEKKLGYCGFVEDDADTSDSGSKILGDKFKKYEDHDWLSIIS